MSPPNTPAAPPSEPRRWDHVTMEHEGRTLLGDVRSVDGGRLTVHHFNGEPWPVRPLASEVQRITDQAAPHDEEAAAEQAIEDAKERVQQAIRDLNAARDAAERRHDCKVCGEPRYAPCLVDRHEQHARAEMLAEVLAWLRNTRGAGCAYAAELESLYGSQTR